MHTHQENKENTTFFFKNPITFTYTSAKYKQYVYF